MGAALETYRLNAADHARHLENGDVDASNACHDRLWEALLELTRQGRRSELFALYHDTDPSVQCWAAAHTLELDELRALDKLQELERARLPGISFDAKHTIAEWKSGNLRFLPESGN